MHRSSSVCLRRLICAAIALCSLGTAARAADPVPEWIWTKEKAGDSDYAFFRKPVEVKGKLKSAVLSVACDNRVSIFVNAERIVEHGSWSEAVREDVTKKLKEGKNILAFRALNEGGAAAFIARLSLEYADGKKEVIASEKGWLCLPEGPDGWQKLDYDDKDWKPAVSLGKLGVQPWGAIAIEGGPTATATAAATVTVPEGFQVELLYSVPKGTQGSWVAMTSDPKGRLIVSDQQGSLYRVTVGKTPEDTKVEEIELNIGAAQGLLYAYDALYVTVNGGKAQGSGVYRVTDTNGDDKYDNVELFKKIQGGGEHGPHALRLGPDGRIWFISGNHTKIPDGLRTDSPHRNWAEDLLLPRNPDGNGHATGVMAPGGWVASFDKDGKDWSLYCGGFRNQYDIAFNQDGELFTYDADMEWDTGTPWYRPTRVNHCTSAAEYGWRYGTGKWPAYYADSLGAVVDIGLGSPTGIEFGTGAKFPAKYQRALYINDWTYGKIYAVHMVPDGASYTGTFETFCSGKPLPVTDICVNTDGALYFTVGGRGTQSGLYRVTYTGSEPTSPAGPDVSAAATKARALRKDLEKFHVTEPGSKDAKAIETAWPHLNSSDRVLRNAARLAIEHQDLELWKEKALSEKRITAQIHALIAVCRSSKEDAALQAEVLQRLNALPYKQLTEEQTLDALRCYSLAFIRLGGKPADGGKSVITAIDSLFPHDNEFVSREACNVLIYLEAPGVIERAMTKLKSSQTQQEQMFYAFVLRNMTTGWTEQQHREHFSWMQLAESKYAGGSSFKKFIQQIRKDTTDKMTEAEKTALADVIAGKQSVEVVTLETTRQFVHNWQMADLLPMLDQAGKGRNFEKGKAAYQATQCYKCHRFSGEGGDTGPDITGVGNRFDAKYLLEALIEPSKVISDQYRGVTIETDDGRVIAGRVLNEDTEKLFVRTDPFAREPVAVLKKSIETRQPSKVSEMPQGLINVLKPEEILDLIAFMRSGGKADDPAFK